MSEIEWRSSSELVDYEFALSVMEKRVDAIISQKESELAWLIEHNSIYTAGSSAQDSDILSANFPVYKSGRGGKYTYHGPGQRVGYLLLDLKKRASNKKPDLKKYVYDLEELVISVLKELDVKGERKKDRIGIWVTTNNKEEKIAAIGIRVRKWITFHGFAINVQPNLDHFSGIIPCGLDKFGVTSLQKLGVNCSLDEFDQLLKQKFYQIF